MAAEAAESLLREILAEPRAVPRSSGRPSPRAVRLVAIAAVAAVALAAAAVLSGGERGGVASAAVVRHALAALAQPPGTILHVDMTGTQTNADGTTITWRDESWQASSAPYDRRQVETTPAGTTVESATAGGMSQVYDPAANTIYTSTPAPKTRTYWLDPGPTANTYLLRPTVFRVSKGHPVKAEPAPRRDGVVITAAQAAALKDGTDVLRWVRRASHGTQKHPRFRLAVVPARTVPKTTQSCNADPDSQDFRHQILNLLRSCGGHLVGPATVDGRDTLEIRSRDGHTTYYVDPQTYAPVELDTTGTGGGTSLRFRTYAVLPAGGANAALLSLAAQHPSATVDRSPHDYQAAELRLFPNG
jgi:hypothetical protein